LGFDPDTPDTQLGYIVPNGNTVDGVANVERFVEKPSAMQARHLIKQGGLWNAFILAAKGTTLVNLFRARMPAVVEALQRAVRKDMTTCAKSSFTHQLYHDLPSVDFSRDVLPGQESSIKVIRVPHCGWSDLGTPEQIGITLRRMQPQYDHIGPNDMIGLLVLATQYKERHRTSSYASDD